MAAPVPESFSVGHSGAATACQVTSAQALQWVFQRRVSCCFQPGGPRYLGYMPYMGPTSSPVRMLCPLTESSYSQRLSDLNNNWACAQGPGDLVHRASRVGEFQSI